MKVSEFYSICAVFSKLHAISFYLPQWSSLNCSPVDLLLIDYYPQKYANIYFEHISFCIEWNSVAMPRSSFTAVFCIKLHDVLCFPTDFTVFGYWSIEILAVLFCIFLFWPHAAKSSHLHRFGLSSTPTASIQV